MKSASFAPHKPRLNLYLHVAGSLCATIAVPGALKTRKNVPNADMIIVMIMGYLVY